MQALGNLFDIVEGFPCVDLVTGANDGDYVSLENAGHICIVFISGLGTATEDPTLIIQQADTNAGGNVKDLDFIEDPIQVWKKQAATSLAAVTNWSDATGDTTGNDWTNGTSAEQSLIWVAEFDADQLDVDNGFDHVRATVADIGCSAQPGYLFYILTELRYADSPDGLVSPL